MPRTAEIAESLPPTQVADCSLRTPFEVSQLPLAARLYRYRKGAGSAGGILRRVVRIATPSRLFLRALFAWAGKSTRGEFLYSCGIRRHNIKFRFSNTQFRALYFPEYAHGYEPETTCLIDKILAAEPRATFYD